MGGSERSERAREWGDVREELGALAEPPHRLDERRRDIEVSVAAHLAELEGAVPEKLVVRRLELRRRRGEDVEPRFGVALVSGHEDAAVVAHFLRLVHRCEEARSHRNIARGYRRLLFCAEGETREEKRDDGLSHGDTLSKCTCAT